MSGLDEFFAKKDRRKNKKTTKFSTPEELVKKLEVAEKNDLKVKKERTTIIGQDGEDSMGEEETWKDFEEEKKDYTGLKIGHLTLSDEEQFQGSNAESDDTLYDGDSCDNESEKHTGPWKRLSVEPAPPEKSAPTAPVKGYVPPHLRKRMHQTSHNHVDSRHAPDITNEQFFPTLQNKKDEPISLWKYKKRNIEDMRNGGHIIKNVQVETVHIGNRYSSLNDTS